MIRSFRDKDAERLFQRQRVAKFAEPVRKAAVRKLIILNAAASLDYLYAVPGNRLEKLKGGRKGQFSIRVNDQWRVCFRWVDRDAYDVEIVDYH